MFSFAMSDVFFTKYEDYYLLNYTNEFCEIETFPVSFYSDMRDKLIFSEYKGEKNMYTMVTGRFVDKRGEDLDCDPIIMDDLGLSLGMVIMLDGLLYDGKNYDSSPNNKRDY